MMARWHFGALRQGFYDVIVADPPWPYELRSERGEAKSYALRHGVLPVEAIAALRVGDLARMPCLLLLWSLGAMLPEALAVMRAWGFVPQAELAWRKVTRRGRVRLGTGYRVRSCHQPVLLGTLGNPQHRPFPSLFDGVVREHGRKPDEFYALVERACPQRWYADLFADTARPGWDSWRAAAGVAEPVVDLAGGRDGAGRTDRVPAAAGAAAPRETAA